MSSALSPCNGSADSQNMIHILVFLYYCVCVSLQVILINYLVPASLIKDEEKIMHDSKSTYPWTSPGLQSTTWSRWYSRMLHISIWF